MIGSGAAPGRRTSITDFPDRARRMRPSPVGDTPDSCQMSHVASTRPTSMTTIFVANLSTCTERGTRL
jgi:hypothetical protein